MKQYPIGPAEKIIKEFEGLELKAYQDTGGVWTIGWGTIKGVKKGMTCTIEQAQKWLDDEVNFCAAAIAHYVHPQISDNAFAALVSFAYNVGVPAFAKSTLLAKLNAGKPMTEVAAQFARWNKDNGKVVPGLTRRRKLEAELFLKA